jgi:hypothetical protein
MPCASCMSKPAYASLLSFVLAAGGLLAGCSSDSNDEPNTEPVLEVALGVDGLSAADLTYRDGFSPRGPNDECGELEGDWTVDVEASELKVHRCAEATAERPGRHWITQQAALEATQVDELKQKITAVRRVPTPESCPSDYPSRELTLRWGERSQRYVDANNGCYAGAGAVAVDDQALSSLLAAVRELGQKAAPLGVADGAETVMTITRQGLGAKGPEDECVGDEGAWRVDFAAGTLRSSQCDGVRLVKREVRLDAPDRLGLRTALGAVRPEPKPATCAAGAPEVRLTLEGPGGQRAYVGNVGGCLQDALTTVGEASLGALIERLQALGEP